MNQISSSTHLARQLLHTDCTAQGVFTDVDTAGLGPGNGLLYVHDVHIHNVIVYLDSSSNFVRIFSVTAELSAVSSLCYNF